MNYYLEAAYRIDSNTFFIPDKYLIVKSQHNDIKKIVENIETNFADKSSVRRTLIKRFQDFSPPSFDKTFSTNGGIVLTNNCHLRCKYCFSKVNGEKVDTISIFQAKKYIDLLFRNAIFKKMIHEDSEVELYLMGGGEPTYYFDLLVKICEYAKDCAKRYNVKLTLRITTNGIISEKNLNYLILNFDSIAISFDGLPNIHNSNRPFSNMRNSFEIVDRTLNYFNKQKKPCVVITTIYPQDFHKIHEMYQFISNRYPLVRSWQVTPALPIGFGERSTDFFSNDVDYYSDIFLEQYFNIVNSEHISNNALSIHSSLFKRDICLFECSASELNHTWLMPNGNISKCLNAYEDKNTVIASVDNKITSISNTDYFDYVHYNELSTLGCLECPAFPFCGGGCPLTHNSKRNDDSVHNLSCSIQKKYWTTVFSNVCSGKECDGWYAKDVTKNNNSDIQIYSLERGKK